MRTKTLYQLSFGGLLAFLITAFALMYSENFLRIMAKAVAVLATAFGLAACSTVSFTSVTPLYETAVAQTEVAKTAKSPVTTAVAPLPTPKTALRHGRFIVEVGDNLHEIEGGVFTPPKVMPVKSSAAHVLVSNYSTKELLYYRRTSTGSYEPVIGYAVVTPKPEELPLAQVRGQVTNIIQNPSWCPGPKARKKDPTLPAGCLPAGHPQNAMGVVKIVIEWQGVKGFTGIHIHGTEGYSPNGAFWNEDTLGCTRLLNSAVLALKDILGRNAVKEGIQVILERGDTFQRHAL